MISFNKRDDDLWNGASQERRFILPHANPLPLEFDMPRMTIASLAASLLLTLGIAVPAHAQQAQAMRADIQSHLQKRFSFDRNHAMAEFPEIIEHMSPRWGQPNRTGTAETPRLVWIVRVPNDPLGNCVRVDALKFNKSTPGVDVKILTGKCEMYAREKLTINEPAR